MYMIFIFVNIIKNKEISLKSHYLSTHLISLLIEIEIYTLQYSGPINLIKIRDIVYFTKKNVVIALMYLTWQQFRTNYFFTQINSYDINNNYLFFNSNKTIHIKSIKYFFSFIQNSFFTFHFHNHVHLFHLFYYNILIFLLFYYICIIYFFIFLFYVYIEFILNSKVIYMYYFIYTVNLSNMLLL